MRRGFHLFCSSCVVFFSLGAHIASFLRPLRPSLLPADRYRRTVGRLLQNTPVMPFCCNKVSCSDGELTANKVWNESFSFCYYFSEVLEEVGQSITRREAAFVLCVTEVCRPGLMVTCEDTEEAAGGAILMSFGWSTGTTEHR